MLLARGVHVRNKIAHPNVSAPHKLTSAIPRTTIHANSLVSNGIRQKSTKSKNSPFIAEKHETELIPRDSMPRSLPIVPVRNYSEKDGKRLSFVVIGKPSNAWQQVVSVPEKVVVVPLKKPLFPLSWVSFEFADVDYVKHLKSEADSHRYVGLFTAVDGVDDKSINDISQVNKTGVLCALLTFGPSVLVFFAVKRIQITGPAEPRTPNGPLVASVKELVDEPYDENDPTIKALFGELWENFLHLTQIQQTSPHAQNVLQNTSPVHKVDTMKPTSLADSAASRCINASKQELLEVLEETNVPTRLKKVLNLVSKELEIYNIKKTISRQVDESMAKTHRRFLLTEQLKHIKKELGLDQDEKKALIDKFEQRLQKLTIPEGVSKVIKDEMNKLGTLEPSALEYNMTRSYLEWLTTIPWGVYSEENFNLKHARRTLNQDHFGLEDVKARILEFIAVGILNKGLQGKILCFVGPPGVGKTSIGKSIARALGRQFYRFSVGGLGDVAEIKGHRRTYVGSMPGKIIQCLKNTGTSNPVILIDEIDKLGKGHQGDPAAALLEVLDPSQNNAFMDHYLDVPVDISKVLFVCTANVKDTIPGPLQDRMEVINLSGYIHDEKMSIAKQYLIPNAMKDSGLNEKQVAISDQAVSVLIRDYCREAGVRNLQKQIEKIFRKAAYKIVSQNPSGVVYIDTASLPKFIGKPLFNSDRYYRVAPPGVVMGLAWTAMGGATLYVETVQDKSSKTAALKTTGQLGDVMKESTDIAYTYTKKFFSELKKGDTFFEAANLHMHIPEGATPKDGPSAGITMVTALLSLALDQPVIDDLAMTGEVTLTGKVLPIGGVKEKTIAARRSGVKVIIFPKDNKKDWEELPKYIKEGITPCFVDYYKDVYKIAFGKKKPAIKIASPKTKPKKEKPQEKDEQQPVQEEFPPVQQPIPATVV